MKLSVASTILFAAASVQAGPLRWGRRLEQRLAENTPVEASNTHTSANVTTFTPDLQSTAITTTILSETFETPTTSTTTDVTADHEPGFETPQRSATDSNGTPTPSFISITTTTQNFGSVIDGLGSETTKVDNDPVPPPNPTSLEVGLPTGDIHTPTSDATPTTSRQSLTTRLNTPVDSSIVTPPVPDASDDHGTPKPTPSTTTITSDEASSVLTPTSTTEQASFVTTPGTINPPAFDSTPVNTPTFATTSNDEAAPSSFVTTTSSTSVKTTQLPVETPTTSESPVASSAAPIEEPVHTSTEESTPTENPIDSPSSVPGTTTILPEESTSDIVTQTIGRPESEPETTLDGEPASSPTTRVETPVVPTSVEEAISTTDLPVDPTSEVEVAPEVTTTTTLRTTNVATITVGPAETPVLPTGKYQTATISMTPEIEQANLDEARYWNNIFKDLTPDVACSEGRVACINGKNAICQGGTFDISSCPQDQRCVALPMDGANGAKVGCHDITSANAILAGQPLPSTTELPEISEPTTIVTEPTANDDAPSAPTAEASQPTFPPSAAEPTVENGPSTTEAQFTTIRLIIDGPTAPVPAPTNPVAENDGSPPLNENAGSDEDAGSRTTQTVDGVPTVSVTVTITVTDAAATVTVTEATATVTEAAVTVTVTEKANETNAVGAEQNGDRVDFVTIIG